MNVSGSMKQQDVDVLHPLQVRLVEKMFTTKFKELTTTRFLIFRSDALVFTDSSSKSYIF